MESRRKLGHSESGKLEKGTWGGRQFTEKETLYSFFWYQGNLKEGTFRSGTQIFKEGVLLCCCWYSQGQSSLFLYNKPPQTKWLETALLYHNPSSQKSGKAELHLLSHKGKIKILSSFALTWRCWERITSKIIQVVDRFQLLWLWVWGPHFLAGCHKIAFSLWCLLHSSFLAHLNIQNSLLLRNPVIRLGPSR